MDTILLLLNDVGDPERVMRLRYGDWGGGVTGISADGEESPGRKGDG